MLLIHPHARPTAAARTEIAHSSEPARHYGVSTETIRRWPKRARRGKTGTPAQDAAAARSSCSMGDRISCSSRQASTRNLHAQLRYS